MLSLISWGINWLEAQRAAHLVENVTVGTGPVKGTVLPCTVLTPNTNTDQNRVKVQATFINFIFVTQSIKDTGFHLDRGFWIKRESYPDKRYELAFGKDKALFYYNDPDEKAIVLCCVERSC